MTLDSTYDVALDNIIFDPNIYTARKNDERYSVKIQINFKDEYGYLGEFSTIYYPTENVKVENTQQLIQYLNNDLMNFLKKNKMIMKTQKYIFRPILFSAFVQFQELILTAKYRKMKDLSVKWEVSEDFARVMGISELTFVKKPKISEPSRFPKKISCIHVYTDIIEPTYLGEQSVHLLDIIPMQHMMSKRGTLTLFKRVNKTVIDDISIRLTDQEGNAIPFADDVSVSLVLHFKRAL